MTPGQRIRQEFDRLDSLSRERSLTHAESQKLENLMRQLGMIRPRLSYAERRGWR